MKSNYNILNFFRSGIYRIKHRNFDFPEYGLDIFLGQFGSGKTLSVVNLVKDTLIKYPDCRLISNLIINGVNNTRYVCFNEVDFLLKLADCLKNGREKGTIVVLDEVDGFLFDTLEVGTIYYKILFAILKQLRKLHVVFIMTSQLWCKVNKVLRDFILLNGRIVQCYKLWWLPGLTIYKYYDMNSIVEDSRLRLSGEFKRRDILIHSPELYESYDSLAVVTPIEGLLDEVKKDA